MQKGQRIKSLNGDQVVAMVGEKEYKLVQNALDVATFDTWAKKDLFTRDIGVIQPFGEQKQISQSFYRDLFDNLSVMEVNGRKGGFEYSYNVSTSSSLVTVQDTSKNVDIDTLGIDDSYIEIVLNYELQEGHVISASKLQGLQLVVSGEKLPEPAIGGGYRHFCQLVTNDYEQTYNPQLLVKGVVYEIITHRLKDEFGANYAGIRAISTGREMVCRFDLQNAVGVEASLTGAVGDYRPFDGTATQTRSVLEELEQQALDFGGEYAIIGSKNDIFEVNGKIGFNNKAKVSVAQTLRLLVHAEHHRLVSNGVVFQQAGTIRESQGQIKLNEGLYWQMKRAYTIQYGAIGGITRAHLEEASNYAFRNNPSKPVNEREINFEGGKFAVANVLALIQDEVATQLRLGAGVYGTERLLPSSPVKGTALNELSFEAHRFTKVLINNIGWVTVTEDPTLNRISATGDRSINGTLTEQYDYTAWSLIIRDVTDQKYTNNKEMPRGVEMTKTKDGDQGSYDTNNIFLIRPKDVMTVWGTERGRWSSVDNEEVISSSRYQFETYWIYTNVAGWIRDVSKMVVIELDKKARKGFR